VENVSDVKPPVLYVEFQSHRHTVYFPSYREMLPAPVNTKTGDIDKRKVIKGFIERLMKKGMYSTDGFCLLVVCKCLQLKGS
jgi:hypothetical protein